jgi:hypothetical protein
MMHPKQFLEKAARGAAWDAAGAAQAQELRHSMPNPFAPTKRKAKK